MFSFLSRRPSDRYASTACSATPVCSCKKSSKFPDLTRRQPNRPWIKFDCAGKKNSLRTSPCPARTRSPETYPIGERVEGKRNDDMKSPEPGTPHRPPRDRAASSRMLSRNNFKSWEGTDVTWHADQTFTGLCLKAFTNFD